MAKLLQYQEQVSGIPTSLAKERTTPDKWQPNTNIPQSNWHAAKIAALAVVIVAPVLAFANPARAERATPDKWQPETNKPIWDVKRQQHTYPSSFFNPLPLPNPEILTVDKWHPLSNQPRFDVQRNQYLYPAFSTDGRSLTQAEIAKVSSSQSVLLTFPRTTQYQAKTDPLKPLVAPETVTVDKWFRQTEKPTWKVPNQNWITGDYAFDLDASQRAERTTPDRWQPAPTQPLFDTKRQQYIYPVSVIDPKQLTQGERITVDKWQPETNKPLFDTKRQQQTYPASFFNPLPIGTPATFVDAAVYQTNVPYFPAKLNQFLYPSFFDPTKAFQLNEVVTVDKWFVVGNQPRFDIPRNQHLYQNSFFYPEPKEVTDFEDILFQQDVPFALTQKERATPDKWQPNTNVPLFDVKRAQYTYPSTFFHPEPQEVTQFESPSEFGRNVDKVYDRARTQYLYQNFGIDPTQLTQHERITIDKWFKATDHTIWDKARNQYLYPSAFLNPFPLGTNEIVTTDKWQPASNQPLFDLKRHQSLYPYLSIDARHLLDHESITVDKWFVPVTQPFALRQVRNPDQAKPVFVAENVTLDKWLTQAQQPLSVRPRIIDTPIGPVVVQEIVSLDKWFQLTTQPPQRAPSPDFGQTAFVQVPIAQVDADMWFQLIGQPIFIRQNYAYIPYGVAQYCTGNPWFIVDRPTDTNYNQVSRSTDADYNDVSRSSDANYNSVNRASDDSYNPTNRDSNDDWNKLNREC